jgi:hypothetical protein
MGVLALAQFTILTWKSPEVIKERKEKETV